MCPRSRVGIASRHATSTSSEYLADVPCSALAADCCLVVYLLNAQGALFVFGSMTAALPFTAVFYTAVCLLWLQATFGLATVMEQEDEGKKVSDRWGSSMAIRYSCLPLFGTNMKAADSTGRALMMSAAILWDKLRVSASLFPWAGSDGIMSLGSNIAAEDCQTSNYRKYILVTLDLKLSF